MNVSNHHRIHPGFIAMFILLLTLNACSDNNHSPRSTKPPATSPELEGPVSGGGGPDCCKLVLGSLEFDLSSYLNYTPGTATSFITTDEPGQDGRWSIQAADSAPFKSRFVVLRPENAADFNGTVVVEWFNVSGGVDAGPDWVQMHTELVRNGYVWVGVSAQAVGIEGGGVFPAGLKTLDPARYGSLSHPGDSFSYDIYSQAAQAVRHPKGIDPLDGLNVQYMIGVGESQSAGRMVTYVNAIHPTVELFDGFLIHSRANGSAPLSQSPQARVNTPTPSWIRDDFPEPVIGFETETDIFLLGAVTDPQPDTQNFRLWEVAGNAHYDAYGVIKGPVDRGGDPGVAEVIESRDAIASGLIECALPINDGPGHWVIKAALGALDRWIRSGEPAPSAERMLRNSEGNALQRDEFGNALGGIRTPYVEAPVASFSGLGQSGSSFCGAFGTTELFDPDTLATLYPSRAAYIDAIDSSTDTAVNEGFILAEDGELIKAQARLAEFFPE